LPGRIEFLGSPRPGQLEWPELLDSLDPDWGDLVDGSPEDKKLREHNSRAIVFDESTDREAAYAFAIRPLQGLKSFYDDGFPYSVEVRNAFDHGNVWLDMQQESGYTLYTIIDLAVYEIKSPGSGISIPEELASDPEYRDQLLPYWNLINSASAHVRDAA